MSTLEFYLCMLSFWTLIFRGNLMKMLGREGAELLVFWTKRAAKGGPALL